MRKLLAAGLLALLVAAAPARADDAPRQPAAPTPTAAPRAAPVSGVGPHSTRPTAGTPAPSGPTATAEAERLVGLLHAADAGERDKAAAGLLRLGRAALGPLEAEAAREEARAARARALIATIDPAADARRGERWYEDRFREAARRLERGDPLGAVKLLDALLVVDPDLPIRDRITALRLRAKELELRSSVIEARLVPKRVLVAPGEAVEVAIEVKNISSSPLELALPDAPAGDIFGALEVETLEATADGGRTRRRELQKIDKPIVAHLQPGEVWRTVLRVNDERALGPDGKPATPAPGVYRRITISGSIRSQVLVRRDEKFDRFLPLFPVEVHVVDRALHALAADPRRALDEAIEGLRKTTDEAEARALGERLFFAALLVPATGRERAIEALGATLASDLDNAAPAALGALAVLADRPLGDRQAWREWIRRRAN